MVGGGSLGLGIDVSALEWGARKSGWPGLATRQRLGVTHGLGKLIFGLGRAVLGQGRPGQVGFGPGLGGFGSGQVKFRGKWPGGGVTGEKGSGYDQNAAGRGISAQYGAVKENFGLDLRDLLKLE